MNKLFTKIASLTLGLALVAGAGAFLGGRAVKSASATEAAYATCDFTAKTANSGSYYSEVEYGDYKVYGGANNNGGWAYYKFGAKKSKAADPTKVTDNYVRSSQLNEKITKIGIQILSSTVGSEGIVTWGAGIYSDAEFTNPVDTVALSTLAHKTAGTYYLTPTSGDYWSSGNYYEVNIHVENTTTTNGVVWVEKVIFYYESSVPRGELSIGGLTSDVLFKDDSSTLIPDWDPLDSESTLVSHQFESSKTEVLTFSGDTYTAVAPGKTRITLTGTDSKSQAYSVYKDVYVSNEYSFEVGDDIAIVSNAKESIPTYELTGINKSVSTHIGYATEFDGDPSGSYPLTVGDGNLDGTFTFSNEGNYLYWKAENSLSSSTTVDENSSWYVVAYDDYVSILNAKDDSREVLMNQNVQSGTPNPRFACYAGNTAYPRSNIVVLPEPLNPRGSISITSPTETLYKLGDVDSLSYSWTPNVEAPSATISSITWSSSDTAVISVDNSLSTFEAVGPGTAKISYEATDSLGEVYQGSTGNITIVNKVDGSYVKYSSVSVGDTVSIVCETDKTELAGIVKINSNYVGDYAFYESAPDSLYDLTLVEGTAEGSFAFETSDSKYLHWESGNTLNLADSITANSSWSIDFDELGNAVISNVSDSTRVIRWNHGSPRFATYTGGQNAVQLYGPELELSANAIDFIDNLNSLTCDDSGDTAPDVDAWKDLKDQYESVANPLSSQDKAAISTIKAVEHASPVTVKEKTEAAMAKYDYIVAKYNLGQHLSEEYPDFIGRDPDPLRNITEPIVISNNTNSAIIAVTVIALTSVSAIAVLLIVKRRKTY